jgi:hydroxymethylglutaryl-CoA lyase
MDLHQLSGARVELTEVGPRDGLQNEAAPVATADKIAFIDALSRTGLRRIEVSSFVSPAWVPQLADAADVFAGITRAPGVRYTALVPNLKGLDGAVAVGADEVAVFTAATDTFSRKNTNSPVEESLAHCATVIARARGAGLPVRAYLSVGFGCPYEGPVSAATVAALTTRLLAMGAFEVAVSDTIGIAHPGQVARLLEMLLASLPADRLALHFHDTRGTAAANVVAGLLAGIRRFDASAGGIGGCPYAPGAAGNLATEDLLYMLDGLGVKTGVAIGRVAAAAQFIEERLGHAVPSRYLQAERSRRRTAR